MRHRRRSKIVSGGVVRRNDSGDGLSGEKSRAGFSVVTRHWIACTGDAAAFARMRSWSRPMSANDSPAAMRIWLWTRSMPVTSSVTVCSTWMRGFTSMK